MSNLMLVYAEEGSVPVSKYDLDNLVRDSEKLYCIESLALNKDILFDRDLVLAICGCAHEKERNEEVK